MEFAIRERDCQTKESMGQFRPSPMQTKAHKTIVIGKYLNMSAQLLVETLQIQVVPFAFLPHPAVLKGLYSWDFGLREDCL